MAFYGLGLTALSPASPAAPAPQTAASPISVTAAADVDDSDDAPSTDKPNTEVPEKAETEDLNSKSFAPVPEPQTWVIAFCGLTTLVSLQRLRRRVSRR